MKAWQPQPLKALIELSRLLRGLNTKSLDLR